MRTLRLSLIGTLLLAMLGGLSGVALAQAITEQDPAPPIDGQAIAEMVNEAINTGDPAIFDATYAPDTRVISDGEIVAGDLEALKILSGLVEASGNSYRLIGPVVEYPASDGDLYVAYMVEVTGPGHPDGDPLVVFLRVRDGKVIRQVDWYAPDY